MISVERKILFKSIIMSHAVASQSTGDIIIPDGMTLYVNSDLNGDIPQYTLTCISSGGPATIVTWTRNSETVSGGMTVLDNAVTAQYTHTLTVTGRLVPVQCDQQ